MKYKFPGQLTEDKCEDFTKKLSESDTGTKIVEIPISSAKSALGGYASAIQSLITAFREKPQAELHYGGKIENQNEIITEIINKPHKFAAAMFAKSIMLDGKDIKLNIYARAKDAVEQQAISSVGQYHGNLCWFIFVDHSTKGFDKNFYIKSNENIPKPRQIEQIKSVISAMVTRSVSMAGAVISLSERENIGRLFYELFMNTHEHGSRAEDRNHWIRPGIRVVYTNGLNLSEEAVINTIKNVPVLQRYFSSFNLDKTQKKKFIEISLIDSGLGFYGRWFADHPEQAIKKYSLFNEYEVLKKCFSLRTSSSSDANKGLGLPVVMERLSDLQALLKIRSGRLSVYRDFVLSPYKGNDSFEFMDWNTQEILANGKVTPRQRTHGVSITLIIPLEAK